MFIPSLIWCWCLGCMPFHVPLLLNGLLACIIALLASKGFLASVGKHASSQTAWSAVRETALITCTRFFSGMLLHEWLHWSQLKLPWMCWHMLFEVTLFWKGSGTQSATKWLFQINGFRNKYIGGYRTVLPLNELACAFLHDLPLRRKVALFA